MLSTDQIASLRKTLLGRKIALCFGGGVDSTAMMIVLKMAGIRPDVITFANTGAEKPETLQHVERMQFVMQAWGWPEISVVSKVTKATTSYTDLEGNCVDNETLPSLAFGMKSCSIKWKQGPQDAFLKGMKKGPAQRAPHPLWLESKAAGEKIVKLIGYDSGRADLRRSKNLKSSDGEFDYVYPLQMVGWARPECVAAIASELGPDLVPIKSACFFCPASKHWELYWLAGTHPEMFERALKLERIALTGRHSRFNEVEFGDSWEALVANAESFPSSNTTVGLGRKFAWNQWARVNGIVDENYRVIRERSTHFLDMAVRLQGTDNALDVRSC